MQSDYEMGGIHQECEDEPRFMVENNASTSSPFYPNYQFPPTSHPVLQQIHSLPITQHFFPYQHPHYRSMSEEIRVDQSQTAELVAFPASEIRGGGEDALIRGSERYCTQPRQTCVAVWQNQEDSAIWKGEYSNGNAIEKNKQEEDEELYSLEETNKRRVVFGELEAICIRGIASESADDLPTNHNITFPELALNEEAMVNKMDNTVGKFHKRKRGKDEWGRFFKSLVKKLANHQEDLQRSLMETMERLDKERKEREELWREKELEKLQSEEAARAHERRLASTREAALVSCLEKLTGQKIDFQTFKIKEDELAST